MNQVEFDAAIAKLQASVTAGTDAGDSLMTLMQGFAEQLRAAAGDPAAINAIADQMDVKAAVWVAAVQANTPPQPRR